MAKSTLSSKHGTVLGLAGLCSDCGSEFNVTTSLAPAAILIKIAQVLLQMLKFWELWHGSGTALLPGPDKISEWLKLRLWAKYPHLVVLAFTPAAKCPKCPHRVVLDWTPAASGQEVLGSWEDVE